MDKISINLLPSEVLVLKKDKDRQTVILRLSVGILVLVIILTAVVFSLRIFQNKKLSDAAEQLNSYQSQIEGYKEQESLVTYLKQRLAVISPLLSQDSKQAQSYNLISALAPSDINITSLSIDKSGNMILSAVSSNTDSIKTFFDNLTDVNINQGKISAVRLENFGKNSDNLYHLDLTINTI